ncbi:hypothetical protein OQA88_11749 [Cercophora sp. LCS_1]
MSARNRNARGPNRNSGSNQGEEAHLWNQIKDDIRTLVEGVNSSNDALRTIVAQDNYISKNKDDVNMATEEQKLDSLLRSGVKGADHTKQQIDALVEHITVLRALVKVREDQEIQTAGTTGLSGRERPGPFSGPPRSSSVRKEREKEKQRESLREKELQSEKERDPGNIYDFDGAGDSPVPSPIGSHTRKLGGSATAGSDRSGNRDSLPPRGDRDTPVKADSVPPESQGAGSATAAQRAKNTYSKGQDVVFRPKVANTNESAEWMMGRVVQVVGEGKHRRYKVQDADPDLPPDQRVEYRMSSSSMILIPGAGADLPDLEKGKTVLALYPDSTTFYKAEVIGKDGSTGKVSLRFEGEENSGTLQLVERRYVVEYRS